MKLFVSGLINVETTLRVRSFPVTYYPVDYPFFGINSSVSGVGYNIALATKEFGDEVTFCSLVGTDSDGERIIQTLDESGISRKYVFRTDSATPVTIILYEGADGGRRQIYCDLKDIQDKTIDADSVKYALLASDICVLCNTNYNRVLLPVAKKAGKPIATDVHVISSVDDPFNKDFMKYADVLFLSDDGLMCSPEVFLTRLKNTYSAQIMVMGLSADGALLYERSNDRITRVPAVKLGGNVLNTVGAGDALFASFNHYYFNGKSAIDALKRAQIVAALKIRNSGGINGFCDEHKVEEIFSSYEFK